MTSVPRTHPQFRKAGGSPEARAALAAEFVTGRRSFVPDLLPESALAMSVPETVGILRERYGDRIDLALDAAWTDPGVPPRDLPALLQGPAMGRRDGTWLRGTNMVGINVRTVGSFWNVVPYMLTLPATIDAVHLLPIWEAGVVGSLYGIASWELNPEFFSAELAEAYPHLKDTPGQLRALVNLLHATGRTVGMDVIPHTDRYSEITLAFPAHFEWLRRRDLEIVDHREDLHVEVEAEILAFLEAHGPATPTTTPGNPERFFSEVPEATRLQVLFGPPDDRAGREQRRNLLVGHLHSRGYEPVPGTMAPPFRGLAVDPGDTARTIDADGREWRDYVITNPTFMSRVFGPLARFKLYGRRDDNRDWGIDFGHPRRAVWSYVCEKYAEVQARFGFDFMRGDMSHVQMRPDGVPDHPDGYYDLLRAVKTRIAQTTPWFGYFAESFLAPPDVMGYGDEADHLEASDADIALGDLQSTAVGAPEFIQRLRHYHDMGRRRAFAPAFTIITGDKDDPRFDGFYRRGNAVRLFLGLFLGDMPAYMGLGFQVRDERDAPAPNERYTKLFVFQERSGPKATHGPYVWGRNGAFYRTVTRLKRYVDGMDYDGQVRGRPTRWLLPPDATAGGSVIAWIPEGAGRHLFVANLDTERGVRSRGIPGLDADSVWDVDFSTEEGEGWEALRHNGVFHRLTGLGPGEGRVYARAR